MLADVLQFLNNSQKARKGILFQLRDNSDVPDNDTPNTITAWVVGDNTANDSDDSDDNTDYEDDGSDSDGDIKSQHSSGSDDDDSDDDSDDDDAELAPQATENENTAAESSNNNVTNRRQVSYTDTITTNTPWR